MSEVRKITDNELKNLLEENQRVIIKFYADWCGTCKLMSPKYKKLAEDSRYENVVFLDINAEENPKARTLAGVDNLPFFATFKAGKLVQGDATSKIETVEQMLQTIQT